ncbi:hypothetical protein Pcac1_g8007 [Phytophthora cactorum]|nr:hypothetical protein Pcac1_g8007 [Phytophthora cactorum]KAG2968380.1 hypothetical protein PC120_g26826 [Phytophthora cactorum]KAG3036873.1 hypothetical protein PC121_g24180 [Phytophthora cactorum]KAG3130319.1 hypothetical protein PC128_g26746 [Phytophthora cactorum]KAG4037231.1 hypothetical protein PC123_g27204 [Phytophthora cactorum]
MVTFWPGQMRSPMAFTFGACAEGDVASSEEFPVADPVE